MMVALATPSTLSKRNCGGKHTREAVRLCLTEEQIAQRFVDLTTLQQSERGMNVEKRNQWMSFNKEMVRTGFKLGRGRPGLSPGT